MPTAAASVDVTTAVTADLAFSSAELVATAAAAARAPAVATTITAPARAAAAVAAAVAAATAAAVVVAVVVVAAVAAAAGAAAPCKVSDQSHTASFSLATSSMHLSPSVSTSSVKSHSARGVV